MSSVQFVIILPLSPRGEVRGRREIGQNQWYMMVVNATFRTALVLKELILQSCIHGTS